MRLNVANNNISNLPKMSGYRCVNYYELCRLCTASQGTKKVHIFSEEAKRTNLLEKISGCLPIVVSIWPPIFVPHMLNSWMAPHFLIPLLIHRRWAKTISYRRSCVPSVYHKWNRLLSSVNHVWMLKRCWKVVWTHRNYGMAKRFEWYAWFFTFWMLRQNCALCFGGKMY